MRNWSSSSSVSRRATACVRSGSAPILTRVTTAKHGLVRNNHLRGHWAVDVSGNWRMTFAFEGGDAVLVDYRDYH